MTKTQKIILAVLSVFALGLLISVGYESHADLSILGKPPTRRINTDLALYAHSLPPTWTMPYCCRPPPLEVEQ